MFKVIYFFIVTVLGWNMTQTCSWQVSSHFVTPGWLMLLELLSVWFNELIYLYSELFYKDKTVLSPRDTLRFPQLAETMETISKEGADAFYTGKIARHLIQDVQERSMNCLYINAVAVIRTDVVLSKQFFGTCACLHCLLLFFSRWNPIIRRSAHFSGQSQWLVVSPTWWLHDALPSSTGRWRNTQLYPQTDAW